MSKPSSQPGKIKVQTEPFNLDAFEAEAAKHDYTFTLADRDWVMKPLGRMDRKTVKRIGKMTGSGEIDESEYMDEMLKAAMGEEQFAEFDQLPLSQDGVGRLFEDWTDHSGIQPGESSASADS